MWDVIKKHKEIIIYGICGILTTVINTVSYIIFAHYFHIHFLASNAMAWVIAIAFAYYTNSLYVFGYAPIKARGSFRRLCRFVSSRIFTGIIDMFLMWILVDIWLFPDNFTKVIVNVIVIILNYIMSKFLVFNGVE